MATNSSYDTLRLKIEADSGDAQSNVAKLYKSLTNLETVSKNLDFEVLKKLQKVLQDISKIDFSNVTRGLDSVAKSFKALQDQASKGSSKKGNGSLGDILNSQNPQEGTPNFELVGESYGKGFEMLKQELVPINNQLMSVKGNAGETLEFVKNLGQAGTKLNPFLMIFQELGEAVVIAVGGFKKLVTQFFRIVRYRIIRKVIQDIYKSLSASISELANFDASFGATFNEIKNSLAFVGNAFGGVASQILTMLQPVITILGEAFGNLGNSISEMFARMNGANGYAKAIKGAKDYASELKKTQSIGIDELNVLAQDDDNYEWVEFGAEGTRNMLGDMSGIAKLFVSIGEIVSDLLDLLMPVIELLIPFLDKVLYVVGAIIDVLEPLLKGITGTIGIVVKGINLIFALLTGDMDMVKKLGIDIVNSILSVFSAGINFFFNILNTLAEGIEWSLQALLNAFQWIWGGDTQISLGRIPEVHWSISGYAEGGFPEDGLFMANHGELVGTFDNGQTAVANNEEIIEGIKRGVMEGMMMSGGGETIINLDGQTIARAVTKQQNNFGQDLIITGQSKYVGR